MTMDDVIERRTCVPQPNPEDVAATCTVLFSVTAEKRDGKDSYFDFLTGCDCFPVKGNSFCVLPSPDDELLMAHWIHGERHTLTFGMRSKSTLYWWSLAPVQVEAIAKMCGEFLEKKGSHEWMSIGKNYPMNECVSDIHNQINKNIYNRNIPSQRLQPYIDVRPVMTKYSYLPIVDPRKSITTTLMQVPTFNIHNTFNPGNDTAPWSGFASNVNTESELRNQIYALQKCSQSVYVPTSTSSLYAYHFKTITVPNPHELLFKQASFDSFNPNPNSKICGSGIFYNNTRCQVKDITKQSC